MKTNEFRLGNWLMGQSPVQVTKIFDENSVGIGKGDPYYTDASEGFSPCLVPIPLTEDLLIKAGFEKRDNGTSDQFHIGINPITHDWLFDLTWIKGYQYPFYRNGHHEIKYVHQLQNLFYSLTSTELPIQL